MAEPFVGRPRFPSTRWSLRPAVPRRYGPVVPVRTTRPHHPGPGRQTVRRPPKSNVRSCASGGQPVHWCGARLRTSRPLRADRRPARRLDEADEAVGGTIEDDPRDRQDERGLRHRLHQFDEVIHAEHALEAFDRVQLVERGLELVGGHDRAYLKKLRDDADDGGGTKNQQAGGQHHQQRGPAESRRGMSEVHGGGGADGVAHQGGDLRAGMTGGEEQQ